ncbi:MAG: guanylate kinase [Actinomycetota bacterium]
MRRRHPSLGLSVSWTTRPKRSGEIDGDHYRFVGEATFREALGRDEFIEHEEYRGHLYGTPWAEVRRAIDEGRDLLFEIDVRGAHNIKRLFDQAVAIFLYPPSEAVLAERLRGRGTDSPEQIQARLEAAHAELAEKDTFDHAVLNDDVGRAVEAIEAILGFPSSQGAPS